MSTYIEYKLPFIFSSSEDAGARNISEDGSSFEVILDRPIVVPRHAKNCFITVQNSTAWWNVFNIQDEINDQLDIEYFDGILTVNFTITVEPGLYDLDHLNEEIGRELVANSVPQDLFTLIPDQATQKSVIQFNYSGIQLDMSIARNFADLLGFEERLIPLAGQTSGVQFEKSDNIANFNQVDYLLIHSDLVSRGIRINDRYQNVISQLLIDVSPGSQITDSPFNPPEIPCDELIGEKRRAISFWISDQNNVRVNTQGELFSVRLIIHYFLKIDE